MWDSLIIRTSKITKINLSNYQNTPKTTKIPKNDQNTLETSKMIKIHMKPPKYLWGRVSTYLVILGTKCHFSKIGYKCNFVIPQGCQCIPFFLLFSIIHKINTKTFSICFLFWDKAIPNIQPP